MKDVVFNTEKFVEEDERYVLSPFHLWSSLYGVTAGVRLVAPCAPLLSALISHAKLRASQPQTAAAEEPQGSSYDILASLRLQMTSTLARLAPNHTHIDTKRNIYCMWWTHTALIQWPRSSSERQLSQYIPKKKLKNLSLTGNEPIQYQSSTALMHIYYKGERTLSTEYQSRMLGSKCILPVR